MFQNAADLQAKSIGVEAAGVYTEHPIQDRTDAEMVEIADRAVDAIVAELTRQD